MAEITVTPYCDYGGNSLDIAPTLSSFSVYRQIHGEASVTPIRGLIDITGSVLTSIIDIEVPLDRPVRYYLLQRNATPVNFQTATSTVFVDSVPLQSACGFEAVLRDLFSPVIEMTTGFCLGQIIQSQYAIRAGVFPILGRRSPVVAIDEANSMGGTMRLIARTEDELIDLREKFADPDPMLLQTVGYDFGPNGVLFFQPLNVTERWMPNATMPQHVFEIEYVEILSPPLSVVFSRDLSTYDQLNAEFTSYTQLTAEGLTYSGILA